MSPSEARAKLTRDATIHGAEFIAVHRATLLLALSEPAPLETAPKKRRPKQTSTESQS